MVDSLAITSATPPATSPQATRAAASPGDDVSGNFAQALHAAHDTCSSTAPDAQATAAVKAATTAATTTAGKTSKVQAAVEQGSTALADGFSLPSIAGSVEAVATKDEVATVTEIAAPTAPAAPVVPAPADAEPAAAGVQNADRTNVRPEISLALAASQESKIATSAAADHPASADTAKPHGKKHSVAASDDANLASPAQTPPAANSVVAAVSPSPASSAPPSNGRTASPQRATSVRVGGPSTQPSQTGASAAATVIPTPFAQAGPPPPQQQAGDVVPTTNAGSTPQQDVQPAPPLTTDPAVLRPSLPIATGSLKNSQIARAAKDGASPVGNAAPDDSLASTTPSLGGKAVDAAPTPGAPAPLFVAALSRHVAAETTVSPGAQPLNTHAAPQPSQSTATIGSDLQASGLLVQPSGEAATRSAALEVGFHDANLGWLSVRATTDVTGSLHAAVGAKTPAALAAVDTMLPALDRFLQQENVAVHSVSTASAAGGMFTPGVASATSLGHAGSDTTGSSAQQQGTGRDASQQRNHDRNSGTDSASTGTAASRLTPTRTVLRYSQPEQLSTVSVRI